MVKCGTVHIGKVYTRLYRNIWMIQHVLEHPRITVQRHGLEAVGEVAIVRVRAGRNARCHAGLKSGRLHSPLLARVVKKELLIQVAPDAVQHNILAAAYRLSRFAHLLKIGRSAGFIEI
ncbi:hypothetical protein SDC9_144059 [bioreactor metagenome]|uniref:Uncharacterized protein n=1 Tax=bioreactor metagenome TaxID=1076179 RepID=A0A645E7X7_9ZZZZ